MNGKKAKALRRVLKNLLPKEVTDAWTEDKRKGFFKHMEKQIKRTLKKERNK